MTEQSYTFGLVSDIHIDLEGGGARAYFRMAGENFADALRLCRDRGTDFILSAGDQITAAEEARPEWEEYCRIIAASGYHKPVFACFGNHEARPASTRNIPIGELEQAFLQATQPHRGFHAGSGLYYSFDEPVFGDRYIITALEGGMEVPFTDEFSAVQLDWLEEQLSEAYEEKRRVFLVQHASVYGYGPGEDTRSPAYDGSLHTGAAFPHNTRFVALTQKYPGIIWLSGHTHLDLRDGHNDCFDGCHMLHIPALCGTTRLVGPANARRLDRTFYPDTAQGYLVTVTADCAVFRGMNFNTGEAYPDYTYIITRE